MDTVLIRQARPDDAASITSVVNQAYRPEPGNAGWTHEASLVSGARVNSEQVSSAIRNSVVLVALVESDVQGCVQIEADGRIARIGMLAVKPSLQNSGIGKLLLSEAEAFAVQRFDATESVLVIIAARQELLAFYLRRGYHETGTYSSYPVDAGVGTPGKDAMVLTTLRKHLTSHATRDVSCVERPS